jgi:hypothetical protein
LIAVTHGRRAAVEQVFKRFLTEAQGSLGQDHERIRKSVVGLETALAAEMAPPRPDRYSVLRSHARAIVAEWLEKN